MTAVVLTLGESSTARALESLAVQTSPLHEVVVVEKVSPFFRAFNEGASRVSTQFFVQVDADMALDPTCVQELRAAMEPDVALAYGELRDPLMGQVVGIKMFRTECVRRNSFRDSISPDTDFRDAILRAGWKVMYMGLPPRDSKAPPRTFGDHRPDYTPRYIFGKYLLEGRRYRYRADRPGLSWHLERLEARKHSLATFAQIAMSHGFFLSTEGDELKPFADDPRARWLTGVLISGKRCDDALKDLPSLQGHEPLRTIFLSFLGAGRALASARAGATVRDALANLSSARRDSPTLVAKLALGHGFLGTAWSADSLRNDERALKSFLLLGIGRRVTRWKLWQARMAAVPRRYRPGAERVRW